MPSRRVPYEALQRRDRYPPAVEKVQVGTLWFRCEFWRGPWCRPLGAPRDALKEKLAAGKPGRDNRGTDEFLEQGATVYREASPAAPRRSTQPATNTSPR
jgi:hypothetical protein